MLLQAGWLDGLCEQKTTNSTGGTRFNVGLVLGPVEFTVERVWVSAVVLRDGLQSGQLSLSAISVPLFFCLQGKGGVVMCGEGMY